ncbi:MAG: AAA family ATPase [Saccharofermentans sp.]|nr:AAA family ATPase [Saccharofermentans sp.]
MNKVIFEYVNSIPTSVRHRLVSHFEDLHQLVQVTNDNRIIAIIDDDKIHDAKRYCLTLLDSDYFNSKYSSAELKSILLISGKGSGQTDVLYENSGEDTLPEDNDYEDKDEEPEHIEITEPEPVPSAQDIYDLISARVWKQTAAIKAASILMENVLNGRRQNIMFVGPTGCGKTYIWRVLSELFPGRIHIVDVSHITNDGWHGSMKWGTIFNDVEVDDNKMPIMVLDEADKMIAPRFSGGGDNVSMSIMSEALKMLEGSNVIMQTSTCGTTSIDTSKVSFVLCGAFSQRANDIADSTRTIGFISDGAKEKAYSKPLTVEDIIEFGATPEFMGRIESVVNLEPMTEDDYVKILTECEGGPIQELEEMYGVSLDVSRDTLIQIANKAFSRNLGVRGVRSFLRQLLDNQRFDNSAETHFCL